jgi:hypothetical protein
MHKVLVEIMFEPSKGIRYCFYCSIFAKLFLVRRENVMVFDESP